MTEPPDITAFIASLTDRQRELLLRAARKALRPEFEATDGCTRFSRAEAREIVRRLEGHEGADR
jgi:hypothetical protein